MQCHELKASKRKEYSNNNNGSCHYWVLTESSVWYMRNLGDDDEQEEDGNGGDGDDNGRGQNGVPGTVPGTLYALFHLMPENSMQQTSPLFYR